MDLPITTPPIIPTLASTTPAAASPIASVDVAVVSTPPNIEQLLRQISISGTVTSKSDAALLILSTAIGDFQFSYSQSPDAAKQQLVQQLETLTQTQKAVTAVVQPGSPPSQAVLFLPNAPSGTNAVQSSTSNTSPQPATPTQPLTLSVGTTVSAVVLPPDIIVPGSVPVTAPKITVAPPLGEPAANPSAPAPTNSPTVTSTPISPSSVGTTATSPIAQVIQPNLIPATPLPSQNNSLPAQAPAQASNFQPLTPQALAPQSPVSASALSLPTAPQTAAAATPVAQPNVTAPAATITPASPFLQPGKDVVLHIDAVTLPSAPAPVPLNPNQVAATVIGNGSNGQLILKSSDATLYIRADVTAPLGTNLLLTVDTSKPAPPAILPPLEQQSFTSLQQTLEALAQINPQLAQQFIDTHIPQPNTQLAAPLLFFLHALKQGNPQSWLGKDNVEILTKANKMALLSKLTHDLSASVHTERDPTVGEWKSYPVPIYTQQQFQNITLHVHGDGHQQTSTGVDGDKPKQVRFLIDTHMSRLGPIQLDGLVRPKKLDMILRSESSLPAGLPQDLRTSYIKTIEAIGFTGSLSFQIGKQNWIVPHKENSQSLVT